MPLPYRPPKRVPRLPAKPKKRPARTAFDGLVDMPPALRLGP